MDETEFQQFYKAALDVLWRWILSRAFRDQRAVIDFDMERFTYSKVAA
jgi:hypothetical protein